MAKHDFKLGQYYKRKVDGLIYKVKDCKRGDRAICMEPRDCKNCKVCLMLVVSDNDMGYCAVPGTYSTRIRKLTRTEVLLKDY